MPPVSATGPFAEVAVSLHRQGLCPIPCGGDDGRKPLLSTSGWLRRPGRQLIHKLAASAKFRHANVGLLTGLSGVTVVDVDAMEDVAKAIDLFGPTPLWIKTPRRGVHLYFRSSGETCGDLRHRGLQIDVKGIGGLVIVPPSRRWTPPGCGAYAFQAGSWNMLSQLPEIHSKARAFLTEGRLLTGSRASQRPSARHGHFVEGTRNSQLFHQLLRIARGCESEEELVGEAQCANLYYCDPPLPDEEVLRSARSAWGYEARGHNFAAGGGFACSYRLIEKIGNPEALWLYQCLLRAHQGGRPDKAFAISPRAMAAHGVAAPLGERAIRRARDCLVGAGVLELIHRGGRGEGDPNRYSLLTPPG